MGYIELYIQTNSSATEIQTKSEKEYDLPGLKKTLPLDDRKRGVGMARYNAELMKYKNLIDKQHHAGIMPAEQKALKKDIKRSLHQLYLLSISLGATKEQIRKGFTIDETNTQPIAANAASHGSTEVREGTQSDKTVSEGSDIGPLHTQPGNCEGDK